MVSGYKPLALQIVNIHPVENKFFRIQWEIDVDQTGPGPFTFDLHRSGAERGPWDQIATGLTGITFDDNYPLLHGMSKDTFYYVEASPGGFKSLPTKWGRRLPKAKRAIVQKIINDERLLLVHGMGSPAYIVKRRQWGERCKKCWDPGSGQVIKSKCGACYGTSFEQGFLTPIDTLMHIKPSMPGSDPGSETSSPEVENAQGFMQAFPSVSRGDFVVEPYMNKRWEVIAVTPTEILRTTVHQDITLSRLPTAHVIYTVEVPLG